MTGGVHEPEPWPNAGSFLLAYLFIAFYYKLLYLIWITGAIEVDI